MDRRTAFKQRTIHNPVNYSEHLRQTTRHISDSGILALPNGEFNNEQKANKKNVRVYSYLEYVIFQMT
jgi:hypothetical protein